MRTNKARPGRRTGIACHKRSDAYGKFTYDSGNYFKTLDMAVKAADYGSFEHRRKEAAKRGKLHGIGISTYIEACAMAPSVIAGGARAGFYEMAEVRAHPTGSITVFTGSHSHGQGHETTFAQLVADRFGVPLETVDIVHGDTGQVLFAGHIAGRNTTDHCLAASTPYVHHH
jgi:aerobic carbon-monoxide dehydrogenase large subunit